MRKLLRRGVRDKGRNGKARQLGAQRVREEKGRGGRGDKRKGPVPCRVWTFVRVEVNDDVAERRLKEDRHGARRQTRRPARAATAIQVAIQNSPGRPSKRSDERGKKARKMSGSEYDDRADKGAIIGWKKEAAQVIRRLTGFHPAPGEITVELNCT